MVSKMRLHITGAGAIPKCESRMQHLTKPSSGAKCAEVSRKCGAQQAEEEDQKRTRGERKAKD